MFHFAVIEPAMARELEQELIDFMDGLAREAERVGDQGSPSLLYLLDDMFAGASPAKIAKTLLDRLLSQTSQPLVDLLGPSSARALESMLPEGCRDEERLKECREETASGTEIWLSARLSASTAIHAPKEECDHVRSMRQQIWKALRGGSAFDRDREAHALRQELREAPNVTSLMADNLMNKRCPLPFESARQWDDFCSSVAWALARRDVSSWMLNFILLSMLTVD